MKRKGHRLGLGKKLSLMLVACILLVSLGLVAITYSVYCRKVDSVYREKAERAANAVATRGYLSTYYVKHLREMIETEEFRQVRERAVAANDEGIILNWMRNQPPTWYEMDYYNAVIRYACKAADFESYFREFQGCYGVEGIAMSDYSSFM